MNHRPLNAISHTAFVAVLLLVLGATVATAQRGDTLRVDSAVVRTDSLRQADSVRRVNTPPPYHDLGAPLGSVVQLRDFSDRLPGKRDIIWRPYNTLFDALQNELPGFALTQGLPGLVRGYSIAGASPGTVGVLYNGRPLRDLGGEGFDLELYPMEFLEGMEVLTGARAALYGDGESLAAVNLVEPRYDVDGSYTRLWHSQSAYSTSATDVTYARNVVRRLNFTLGLRRLVSNGMYANQSVSNWSVRGALRWNPSDAFALSLTNIYTDQSRGANGGLAPGSSYNPVIATVNDDSTAGETTRNDLTLTARWYPVWGPGKPDSAGRTVSVPDTNLRMDATAYHSHDVRNTLVNGVPANCSGQSTTGDLAGVRGAVALLLSFARLEGNALAEVQGGSVSRLRAGGMLELPLTRLLLVRGTATFTSVHAVQNMLLAAEAVLTPVDSLFLRGALRSWSLLSSQETAAATPCDSTHYLGDQRTSVFAEAELSWRHDGAELGVRGLLRRATDLWTGVAVTVKSAEAHLRLPLFGVLSFDTRLLATIAPDSNLSFPEFHGLTDLSARLRLFEGNLDLLVGTSLEYQTLLHGLSYNQSGGDFFTTVNSGITAPTLFPQWNVHADARIGSAHVRVGMSNILDTEFYSIQRYPVMGRSFNIGITWVMLD